MRSMFHCGRHYGFKDYLLFFSFIDIHVPNEAYATNIIDTFAFFSSKRMIKPSCICIIIDVPLLHNKQTFDCVRGYSKRFLFQVVWKVFLLKDPACRWLFINLAGGDYKKFLSKGTETGDKFTPQNDQREDRGGVLYFLCTKTRLLTSGPRTGTLRIQLRRVAIALSRS